MFETGDQLTLQTNNGQISAIYGSAASNGGSSVVLTYTDSSPLPAGYVGIQQCDCGGLGSYSNWTGGTGISVTAEGTVSGTTQGYGWPNGTTHTPWVWIQMGSSGGKVYGNGGPPNNYLDYSNFLTFTYTGSIPDPFNYLFEVGVQCSIEGTFFGFSPGGGDGYPGGNGSINPSGAIPFFWGAITYYGLRSSSPPINAYTNCTINPQDLTPPNLYTVINVVGWNYYVIGECSIPEAIISGGTPCTPVTPSKPLLIPEPWSSSAYPQQCTADWGYYYPLWVVNLF